MPAPVQADARGSLDLLVLKILSLAPTHGWGIGQRIEQITSGDLEVSQGSLYPALQRLEHRGLVTSEWGMTDSNRRARYYAITLSGQSTLGEETKSWLRFVAAIDAILLTA